MSHRIPLPIGTVLNNRYRLVSQIAEGGFSLVYLARADNQKWVIKELFDEARCRRNVHTNALEPLPGQADLHERQLQRGREEWHQFGSIRHDHIVALEDAFEANGTLYFVMPYVAGESLMDRVERSPLQIGELLRLLVPIAAALEFIHARQMIHRDVKPDNIWIRKADDLPMLLDLGAARSLEPAHRAATSIFTMLGAPELRGKGEQNIYGKAGPATDVFALAGVCAYALTGREPPDPAFRVTEGEAATLFKWPMPGSEALKETIRWGLKLNVRERPQTITVFVQTLMSAHSHEQMPPVRSQCDLGSKKILVPPIAKLHQKSSSRRMHSAGQSTKNSAISQWLLAVVASVLMGTLFALLLPWAGVVSFMLFLVVHGCTVLWCASRRSRKGDRLLAIDFFPILNLMENFKSS